MFMFVFPRQLDTIQVQYECMYFRIQERIFNQLKNWMHKIIRYAANLHLSFWKLKWEPPLHRPDGALPLPVPAVVAGARFPAAPPRPALLPARLPLSVRPALRPRSSPAAAPALRPGRRTLLGRCTLRPLLPVQRRMAQAVEEARQGCFLFSMYKGCFKSPSMDVM